jgi:hypothetical protein
MRGCHADGYHYHVCNVIYRLICTRSHFPSWRRRQKIDAAARKTGLAPTPFNEDVAAPTMSPAMLHPAGVPPWGLFPPSGVPRVSIAIPAMVPVNPHIAAAGRRPTRFDYGTRWRETNHNLRRRGAEGQRSSKNQSDQTLIHHNTHSLFWRRKLPDGTRTTTLSCPVWSRRGLSGTCPTCRR